MPTFEVELQDGRKFQIEADTAPSEEEVLQALGGDSEPEDSGQGYISSLAASAARGLARPLSDIPGGVGYLTGSDTLVEAAESIEGAVNEALPVNPIYQDDFAMKAAGAVGQAGSMIATAGVGGVVGKALGATRLGMQSAALGSGILAGARGGGQAAEEYGMEGAAAYARIFAGAAIEGVTERYLFGLGTETRAFSKLLGESIEGGVGRFSKDVLTEGGEEIVAETSNNLATMILAPAGVKTPGLFDNTVEAGLLGVVGGATFGAFNAATGSNKAVVPVKATIDGVTVIRGADGVIRQVTAPDASGSILRVLDETDRADLELLAKANAVFGESDEGGVDTEKATADSLAALPGEVFESPPPAPNLETPAIDETGVVVEPPPVPPTPLNEPITQPPPATETSQVDAEAVVPSGDAPVLEAVPPVVSEDVAPAAPVVEGPGDAQQGLEESATSGLPAPLTLSATAIPGPISSAPPDVVGARNSMTSRDRAAMGLPPRLDPVAAELGEVWDRAVTQAATNPQAGALLAAEVAQNPRVLSADEVGLLLHELVGRKAAFDTALANFNKIPEAGKAQARAALDLTRERYQEAASALELSGTKMSDAFRARQMLSNMQYEVVEMLSEWQAANNGAPLNAEQTAIIVAQQAKIASLQAQITEIEAIQSVEEAKADFKKVRAEVSKEAKKAARAGKTILTFLEEMAAKAIARENARLAEQANFPGTKRGADIAPDPASLADKIIIGAYELAKGLRTFAEWSQEMVRQLGDMTQDQLQKLFKQSNSLLEEETKLFNEAAPRVDKRTIEEQVAKNAADGKPVVDRLVYEMVKQKIRDGVTDEQIIPQITAELQTYHPGITERQVSDSFSGYGKVTKPSQDELNKKTREFRRIRQLASAIEDVQKRIPPQRSGPQRDATTQKVRTMQKELSRLMKEAGIERTSADEQLKTALDGVKSRLRNEIEDLDAQIKKGERTKRKPGVEYDQEAKELKARRDELKKVLDNLDVPAPVSYQDKVEQALKALDRDIADLQRRIKEKDFSKGPEQLYTEQLQVKRDERDALREQFVKMREEALGRPELTQEQLNDRTVAALERSIKELDQRIKDGGAPRPPGAQAVETLEIKTLRARRKALREQLKEMVGKKEPTMEQRIQMAEKALDKSIAELDRQITEGDIAPKPKTSRTPETQKLQVKRDERDRLKAIREDMRKAARPPKDPVAEQLKRDKASLNRRIKETKEKIAKGDFSKPERKKPVMDDEKRKLIIELDKEKETWARMLYEEHLRNRSVPAKLLDAGGQTLNTARAILTSFDVSAVLRQGGFIVLGNPLRGLRNLKPMFKAAMSEDAERNLIKDLQERDNYRSGLYKMAKLFLASDSTGTSLTKQEEAFMSRWLAKIPKWAGGGLIRGSQRAYTTFLDRLRADTFDAMLASLQKGPEPTLAEAQEIASFINIATGRGDLGKASQAAVGLNTVFFAPRLVASRFQILAGYPYFKASARTKKLVLQEYAKFLTGAALVYALLSMGQDEDDEPLELDPRSSNFGKVRFGNTRVDPMSGLLQATVLISRLVTGEKKSASGKIVPIRGKDVPYGGDNSFDVMANFARSKFSPAFGAFVNITVGENVVGEDATLASEAKRMVIPMSFSEAAETLEEQGVPKGTALTMLALLGMGVQTYDYRKK